MLRGTHERAIRLYELGLRLVPYMGAARPCVPRTVRYGTLLVFVLFLQNEQTNRTEKAKHFLFHTGVPY